MDLLELLRTRRSVRRYSGEQISEDRLKRILQAGLLAPSSRAIYPVELICVRDKAMLKKLSRCKTAGSAMLEYADAAVVVTGDAAKSDAWIEDCSITMALMMTEATALGVGSCWVQCRGRSAGDTGTEEYVRSLLNIPERFGVLAVLSLGLPADKPAPRELPNAECEKVHHERF